jgi:hypothetical protein
MIKQYGEGTAIICDFCGVKLQFDGNKSGKEAQIALNSQGWVEQGEKVKCAGCKKSRLNMPVLVETLYGIQLQIDNELAIERELLQAVQSVQHQEACGYLLGAIRNIEAALSELRRLK